MPSRLVGLGTPASEPTEDRTETVEMETVVGVTVIGESNPAAVLRCGQAASEYGGHSTRMGDTLPRTPEICCPKVALGVPTAAINATVTAIAADLARRFTPRLPTKPWPLSDASAG